MDLQEVFILSTNNFISYNETVCFSRSSHFNVHFNVEQYLWSTFPWRGWLLIHFSIDHTFFVSSLSQKEGSECPIKIIIKLAFLLKPIEKTQLMANNCTGLFCFINRSENDLSRKDFFLSLHLRISK